jgi:hypothetical protein
MSKIRRLVATLVVLAGPAAYLVAETAPRIRYS